VSRQVRRTGLAWAVALSAVFLAALALLVLRERIPPVAVAWYVVMSGLALVMYRADKAAASGGRRRTPETSLHLVGFLGGWPGALVAQQRYRHKTRKRSFQVTFWCSVAANSALLWFAAGWGAPGL